MRMGHFSPFTCWMALSTSPSGVASSGLFGEHECTVDSHLEESARRLEQPNLRLRIDLLKLGRQTGSSGLVVSDNTVLDRYMHGSPPGLRGRSTTARIVVAPEGDAKGTRRM